jgi:protein-S-isoprenylcysteine O-methyltransferase Ste14
MTAALYRTTVARAPSLGTTTQAPRPLLAPNRAHRIAARVSRHGPWVAPVLALAWPRADLLLVGTLALVLAGSAAVAAVEDEVSGDLGARAPWQRPHVRWLLASVLLAALDVGRLEWTTMIPREVRTLAALSLGLGYLLRTLAVGTNRYYTDLVVVQLARRHSVCDAGPYAHLRHPGDLATVVIVLSLPLALGSLLALAPAVMVAYAVLVRAAREDSFLRAALPGYADYARRVRTRMLPGVY